MGTKSRIVAGAMSTALAASAGSVTVVNSLTKIRRDDTPPAAVTSVSLEAARREFEAFQIVLSGPASNVVVRATSLSGPSSASIAPAASGIPGNIRIYREGFIQIGTGFGGSPSTVAPLSDSNGTGGFVPDPLIPQFDEFDNQRRWNSTDLDVPSGQNQVLWVEIYVPQGQTAGHYTGQVLLAWNNSTSCQTATISVNLKVWPFDLPGKSSLGTYFGSSSFGGLSTQHGVTNTPTSKALSALLQRYAALGLDHRISMTNYDDGATNDLSNYDTFFAPLNAGTSSLSRLNNAQASRVYFIGNKTSTSAYDSWFTTFTSRNWISGTFTYAAEVDEPSIDNGKFCNIGPFAQVAHAHADQYSVWS